MEAVPGVMMKLRMEKNTIHHFFISSTMVRGIGKIRMHYLGKTGMCRSRDNYVPIKTRIVLHLNGY